MGVLNSAVVGGRIDKHCVRRNRRAQYFLTALPIGLLIALFTAGPALAGAPHQAFTASLQEPITGNAASFSSETPSPSAVAGAYSVCPAKPGVYECLVEAQPLALTQSGIRPEFSPALEGGGELKGLDPENLKSAYKLPATGGSGETIAIVDAYNDPNAESDLQKYREKYKVYYKGTETACTEANGCFQKLNQKGENKNYPSNEYFWSLEISLDLDMASAVCPECHIDLVEANKEGNELDVAEEEAASLKPAVISNSWGRAEESAETERDVYFHHPGIPVVAAAGDSGYQVEYPAASPDVIAAGGTTLKKAENSRGWTEAVWSGTGSGCSAYEEKPSWQTGPPWEADKGCTHRTDNDIAADASGESPVSVYDSYEYPGWENVWGTSAATPIISGIEAQASSATRTLAADAFYKKPSMLFHISEGSNGECGAEGSETYYLCHATKEGYNGPTGMGTPDGVFTSAAAPTVTTKPATSVTETGAILNGIVNPNGAETKYYFEYGTTESYGKKTEEASAGSSESSLEESKAIAGLTLGKTYDFRIIAKNSEGTTYGTNQKFTPSGKPSVETKAATSIGETTATLNGSVNPKGLETKYYFDYGTTESYGKKTAEVSIGSGITSLEESKAVTTLAANTTYHFRIVATNSDGTTDGPDEAFATLYKPFVESRAATTISGTEAKLSGIVNPRGFETKYYFEYGTTESYGKKTEEASAGSGTSNVEESKTITGLTTKTTYYFRMVATNSKGTTDGSDLATPLQFKPLPTKKKFTSTGGAFKFAGGDIVVTCSKSSATGEITGASTLGKVVLTFTGCEGEEAGHNNKECRSLGAGPGEIVTDALKGELGTVATKEAASGVGLLLKAETGSEWFVFREPCPLPETSIDGSLAGEVATIGKKQLTDKLVFGVTSGEQNIEKITSYTGTKYEPELDSSYGGLPMTGDGTDELTFEEALEVT
jgi:hypothetical protein